MATSVVERSPSSAVPLPGPGFALDVIPTGSQAVPSPRFLSAWFGFYLCLPLAPESEFEVF